MVETVRPGDEVVAIAFDALGTHVIADARLVARKPVALSHQVAATLPIAFVTAWYALHTLAGMRPGERVLMPAGGGVGLAAVPLASRGSRLHRGSAETRFLRALGWSRVRLAITSFRGCESSPRRRGANSLKSRRAEITRG